MNRVLVFDTTHHAMWAEEVARDANIAAEVVPAPAGTDAKCGLALEVMPDCFESLVGALEREGVPFKVFV